MKEDNKQTTVVVLSRTGLTALSTVRCLGLAGYTVDLIACPLVKGTMNFVSCSKYIHKYDEIIYKKGNEAKTKELLDTLISRSTAHGQKLVLIPTDDFTMEFIEFYRESLGKHYYLPGFAAENHEDYSTYMDTEYQREISYEIGFPAPNEWTIALAGTSSEEEPAYILPEELRCPCTCQPVSGFGEEEPQPVKRILNKKQLAVYLKKMNAQTEGGTILIKQKVKQAKTIEMAGVALGEKVIIPAIIEKLENARHDKSVILAEKIASTDKLEETLYSVINFVKHFHYTGLFDIRLFVSDDKLYLDKIHFRSGRLNSHCQMGGVNLLDIYIKHLSGQAVSPEEETMDRLNEVIISDQAVWEDYARGYKSKKYLNECLAAGRPLIAASDDPNPGAFIQKKAKRTLFKRKLNKRLRPLRKFVRKRIAPILRPLKLRLMGYPQAKKSNQRKRYQARVLVVGRNYCSNLCLARAFGMAGHEVEILRIFHRKHPLREIMRFAKPDALSKYVKAFYVIIVKRNKKPFIKRLIKIANKRQKMLLIPADDYVASIIDSHYNVLSKYYLIPNAGNRAGGINDLMSKAVQKELALQAGLPVVKSCIVKSEKGKFEIPDSVTYPCFIKPNVSKNGSKTKMKRCDSYEELHATFTEYAKEKDFDMLVEDYIEIGRECSILGVSTKEGVLSPGFFGAELGGHGSHRGVALTGRVENCAPYQKLIDDISDFISTLGYEGLFDVDLIESTDGKLYFVELNLRYGGSGYSIVKSGANLPGAFADYMLLGKPIDMNMTIDEPGKAFISERIAIDEYAEGFMTMQEVNQCMDDVDIHFIKDDDDPRPYNHFKKFYIPAGYLRKKMLKSTDDEQEEE